MAHNSLTHSLAMALADLIEKEIRNGVWKESLPGNRILAEHYQVSRTTTLKALKVLESRHILKPAEKGKSRHILPIDTKPAQKGLKNLLTITSQRQGPSSEFKVMLDDMLAVWMNLGGTVHEKQAGMTRNTKPKKLIQEWIQTYQPDAILVYQGTLSWNKELVATGLPVYCLGGDVMPIEDQLTTCGYLVSENLNMILTKLKKLGHTRVLYPDYPGRESLRLVRLKVYREIFGDLYHNDELEAFLPTFKEADPESWLNYWRESLSAVEPSAVICSRASDVLSLYSFCHIANIQIPRDLSIISMTNNKDLQWLWPQPTQMIYPLQKTVNHFTKWIDSAFQMRGTVTFPQIWQDGGSVIPHHAPSE